MRAILGACLAAAFVAVPAVASEIPADAFPGRMTALCMSVNSFIAQVQERGLELRDRRTTETGIDLTLWENDAGEWFMVIHPEPAISCIYAQQVADGA